MCVAIYSISNCFICDQQGFQQAVGKGRWACSRRKQRQTSKKQLDPMEMAWKPLLMMIICHYFTGCTWICPKCQGVEWEDFKGVSGAVSPSCGHWNGSRLRRRVSRDWGTGCIFTSMSEPADLQQHWELQHILCLWGYNSRLAPLTAAIGLCAGSLSHDGR